MKVYVDLVFFINFMFDLLLLMTVSIECKVYSKKRFLLLSSFFGSMSAFLLFLPINNISLFLFKVVISIIMLFIAFKITSKNLFITLIKNLYGNSIILGGVLYFFNNQINYKNIGLIFVKDSTTFNLLIIIISSPIIFYLYHKTMEKEKRKRELLHHISIKYKDKTIDTLGYLDTGNNIKDPYKRRSIILINSSCLSLDLEESILVPFKTIDNTGLIRCCEIKEICVDNNILSNKYLLGISPKNIDINGASCILPNIMEEELK